MAKFLSRVRILNTIAIPLIALGFGTSSYSLAQMPADNLSDEDTAQPLLAENELENLAAPIALYPDALLSQVLVASTYPTEVFEADQFLQQNRYLPGRELMRAAQEQSWDPSIQALVAFPDVLERMNRNLSWTTALGNAFLAQEADVMNAIQNLRAEARENGQLQSGPQLRVHMETQGDQSAIEIQPGDPQRLYVPNYDPNAVWGAPAQGDYPALDYAQGNGFGDFFGTVANLAGFLPGFAGLLGPQNWGWAIGWLAQTLFVNNSFFSDFGFHNDGGGFRGSNVWVHNEDHRLGVPYGNRFVAGRYGRGIGPQGNGWRNFGHGTRVGANGRSGSPYRLGGTNGFSRGNFQPGGSQRTNGMERGWRGFSGREQSALRRRTDGWQTNRGGGRNSFANSGFNRGGAFNGSRSYGSGSGYNAFNSGRGSLNSRSANRSWGGEQRISPARMTSERGSWSGHGSGYGSPSRHGYSSGGFSSHGSSHSSSWKHAFSSHDHGQKAPKMKAPHYAKSHGGGGHSSGGHGGKKSHHG